MAMTATVNQTTVNSITTTLYMTNPKMIYIQPNRSNLRYSVVEIANGALNVFDNYASLVQDLSVLFPNVIIYCRTIDVVTSVWNYFRPHMFTLCFVLKLCSMVLQLKPKRSMFSKNFKSQIAE